ncbi:MAG: hypothetical protein J1E65_09855 [Lachnospiraceae bacterium]|nr:hypothetical protein [Lachnospiraceae bacterium]
MKEKAQKLARFTGLVMALALLVNIFYAPEVLATKDTVLFSTPALTTSDGRVTVNLSLGYQDSNGTYISASIKSIGATTDVSDLVVEDPVISSDKKTVTVKVSYYYKSGGVIHLRTETLAKNAP